MKDRASTQAFGGTAIASIRHASGRARDWLQATGEHGMRDADVDTPEFKERERRTWAAVASGWRKHDEFLVRAAAPRPLLPFRTPPK